jgi:(2R)-phospho-3-sulfolactate synthase (ComA)
MTIWLVRHGASTWNALGLAGGWITSRINQEEKRMNSTALHLPSRAEKPRDTGLTMVIDGGIPLWYFTDLVSSAAEYIDFVKFGWGTAVVSSDLRAKIKVLSTKNIGFYFGGTLFEKYVLLRGPHHHPADVFRHQDRA